MSLESEILEELRTQTALLRELVAARKTRPKKSSVSAAEPWVSKDTSLPMDEVEEVDLTTVLPPLNLPPAAGEPADRRENEPPSLPE